MALRIGKKDNADDWSDEALRQELAQLSGQPGEASPGEASPTATTSAAPASDDPLADLLADMPEGDAAATPGVAMSTPVNTPSAPLPTPAMSTAPAFDETAPVADASAAQPRPKVSPILLAAGLVFLVVAVGAGLWLMLFNKPAEEDDAPIAPVVTRRPPKAPAPPRVARRPAPKLPPPATKVLPSAARVAPPGTPVRHVTPGKAGIMPQGGTAPGIAPTAPGQTPRVVPVEGVPTPVGPPPGMAGQPGKGSTRTTSVQIVRPVTAMTPALAAQLKALWKQGADAKHRGDNAGARRAWQQMLKLHPGHVGVQDAINKLPR
jgi:hypothetical protein